MATEAVDHPVGWPTPDKWNKLCAGEDVEWSFNLVSNTAPIRHIPEHYGRWGARPVLPEYAIEKMPRLERVWVCQLRVYAVTVSGFTKGKIVTVNPDEKDLFEFRFAAGGNIRHSLTTSLESFHGTLDFKC